MARREIIDGDSEIMNVEERVGALKTNGWGDVLVVQALLKYVREGKGGERGFDFLPGEPPLRNPDGIFYRGETDRLILAYQKATNRGFGRKTLTEDGVISHAKGKSTWGTGKKWTIVDLNEQAEIVCLALRHGDDHIKAIQQAYP
jgi:hypothetical protein